MAGALRKTMLYLGLADDRGEHEEYVDEYDDQEATVAHEYEAQVTPLHRTVARVAPVAPATGELRRITTIHPRTYNEAKVIGENFRDAIPVIMNLTDMSDADAKRLVDFAAGLVFGLRGSIERVTSKVFLLSPETVEVNAEEGPAIAGRGVFNQS